MVADCGSIVATENLESKNNGSRQRRKENLKEEIIKHLSKIVQNPSKILLKSTRKRPQIDESASLERFRRQIVLRSAPGTLRGENVWTFNEIFAEHVVPRVGFATFGKSKICQKSIKNRSQQALGPKMAPRWISSDVKFEKIEPMSLFGPPSWGPSWSQVAIKIHIQVD